MVVDQTRKIIDWNIWKCLPFNPYSALNHFKILELIYGKYVFAYESMLHTEVPVQKKKFGFEVHILYDCPQFTYDC